MAYFTCRWVLYRDHIAREHPQSSYYICNLCWQSHEINAPVIAYLIRMHTLLSVQSARMALTRKVSFILAPKVKTCQDLCQSNCPETFHCKASWNYAVYFHVLSGLLSISFFFFLLCPTWDFLKYELMCWWRDTLSAWRNVTLTSLSFSVEARGVWGINEPLWPWSYLPDLMHDW